MRINMRKYEDARIAVWVATAIMTYNAYLKGEKQGTLNEDIFNFKKADIIKEAQKICSNTV